MSYNELEQRGTEDFPVELYRLDSHHIRYEMSAHWHKELELIRVLEGELTVKLNRSNYVGRVGDIFIVNPETVHSAVPKACLYECIVFHMDCLNARDYSCRFFVDSVLNQEYVLQAYHPHAESDFNRAVNSAFNHLQKPSSGYKLMVLGALYQMLGAVIDNHLYAPAACSTLSADKNVPKLKKVLSFIRDSFDQPITLNDMAQAANMSPKYFCSFFKSMTGKTPVDYLNSYRLEKAGRMLLNTDLNVTEIAYACGFNDLSYFIKSFKRAKQITPTRFRKE